MKYITLNDLNNIIKKRLSLIIAVIIISLSYYIMIKFSQNLSFDTEFIDFVFKFTFSYKISIIDMIKKSDILSIGMLILNYGLFVIIAIDIFKNDLSNYDNLLERISLNKWINSKVLANIVCGFIISSIVYLLAKVLYSDLDIGYLFIIKKTFIISIITSYVYIMMICFRKSIPIFVLLSIGILSLLSIKIDITLISIWYIILVFIIITLLLNTICKFTKFSDLKE